MSKQIVGVLGSGTMGGGIAQVAAQAGYGVMLCDVSREMLDKAVKQIDTQMKRAVEKGRMAEKAATSIVKRVTLTEQLADLAPCSFVIEAAPEKLELKQSLFRELDTLVKEDAILATNTSTLSVTQIGAGTAHPERVVGMHFFNPPPLLPLVEVIGSA